MRIACLLRRHRCSHLFSQLVRHYGHALVCLTCLILRRWHLAMFRAFAVDLLRRSSLCRGQTLRRAKSELPNLACYGDGDDPGARAVRSTWIVLQGPHYLHTPSADCSTCTLCAAMFRLDCGTICLCIFCPWHVGQVLCARHWQSAPTSKRRGSAVSGKHLRPSLRSLQIQASSENGLRQSLPSCGQPHTY